MDAAAARELAQDILEWEAQFGPTKDADTAEVAGEDMARWVALARNSVPPVMAASLVGAQARSGAAREVA